MISGNAWAIPRGSRNPGLACKYIKALQADSSWLRVAKDRFDLRKRQGRAFTGLYTANTQADVKIFEDIYQRTGTKQFDDAVTLLVRAPRSVRAVGVGNDRQIASPRSLPRTASTCPSTRPGWPPPPG